MEDYGREASGSWMTLENNSSNTFDSVLMRWMQLEPIIQSEVSQKEKHQSIKSNQINQSNRLHHSIKSVKSNQIKSINQNSILTHIYGI